MATTAKLDDDGHTFTMRRGTWSMTVPLSQCASWLAFYRTQVERFPDHAASYAADLAALDALAEQVGPAARPSGYRLAKG